MICTVDEKGYCERHKMVHADKLLALCLSDTILGKTIRKSLDALAQRRAVPSVQAKPMTPPAKLPKCAHVGGPTGQLVVCKTCAGKIQLKVFACSVYGTCTIQKKSTEEPIACCNGCPSFRDESIPMVGSAMNTADALKLINEPPGTLDPAWKATAEAYTIEIGRHAAAAKSAAYPEGKYAGRGIVVGAGGVKFFGCAWVCVSMLRWLGCKLPVEFWYLGRGEMDPQMADLAKRLDVTVVDARAVAASLPIPPRILNGWELKPFSVLHSRFEEVMYLDADCIPVQNPEKLFESAEYLETGAIFWPDLAPNDGRKEWIPPVVWERCGMTPRNYVDFESGQVVVDKRRCWDAMLLTQWMNEHSDYWYKMVFGDKTTWHLC